MKIVSDFFNKLTSELNKTYFPDVKYYRDKKQTTEIHYAIELFNNGCLTYEKLINKLSKNCNETKEIIHEIVSKYIEDFEGYEYNIIENKFQIWYELNKEDLRDEYNSILSSEVPPKIVPNLKEWAMKRYEILNS